MQWVNVCIRVISSFEPQAAVAINLGNTQEQTLILGHYAEVQVDHNMCLRPSELIGTTGKDYEQEKEKQTMMQIWIRKTCILKSMT